MKKTLLLLSMVLVCIINTYAIKWTVLTQNIGIDSVQIIAKVDSVTGPFQGYLIFKKTIGDSVFHNGNAKSDNGPGIKSYSLYNLAQNTPYLVALVKKQGNSYDTTTFITITTLAQPPMPTVTWTKVPGIPHSKFIVTITFPGNVFYNYKIFGYQTPSYDSTNVIVGNGNKTDTLYIETPNPNTVTNVYVYFVAENLPTPIDTFLRGDSVRTPALQHSTVANVSVSNISGTSARYTVMVTPGTFNPKLKTVLKDSLGAVVTTTPDTLITTSTFVSRDFTGLQYEKFYKLYAIVKDSLGSDTTEMLSFRTLQRTLVAAPTVVMYPATISNTGGLTVVKVTTTPAATDTATMYVLMSRTGNFDDSVRVFIRSGISTQLDIHNIEVTNLEANTWYYFKAVGLSKDGVRSESNTISGLTRPVTDGPTLEIVISDENAVSPRLTCVTNGNGSITTLFIQLKDDRTGNVIYTTTHNVGSGAFDSIFLLSANLPVGSYTVNVSVKNVYFPTGIGKTKTFYRTTTTGIVTHVQPKPDADVDVYDMMGTKIWSGKFSQAKSELQWLPVQIVVATEVISPTEVNSFKFNIGSK